MTYKLNILRYLPASKSHPTFPAGWSGWPSLLTDFLCSMSNAPPGFPGTGGGAAAPDAEALEAVAADTGTSPEAADITTVGAQRRWSSDASLSVPKFTDSSFCRFLCVCACVDHIRWQHHTVPSQHPHQGIPLVCCLHATPLLAIA